MFQLIPCTFGRWSLGLGDPHFVGWATVVVYFIAAVACALVAMRGAFPASSHSRERMFWSTAATFLLLLAINKQLDLQSLLTALGRCVAVEQGWYDVRGVVQRRFVTALLLGGVAALVGIGLLMRGTLARTSLAIVGLAFVGVFVGVRAISFHQVDALINSRALGLRWNWLLELPGPLLVLTAALQAWSTDHPDASKNT